MRASTVAELAKSSDDGECARHRDARMKIWHLQLLAVLIVSGVCAEEEAELPITEEDRKHWAFRPLQQSAHSNIDAFIVEKLRAAGLDFAPEADRFTLIRRLSFDLTGLPPTPEEIDAFVASRSPRAYEELVDRLLASPAYGERWAQHWLDVVRYAESDGFEFDHERKEAWRYRDWVIQALNVDMPYDQFIRWQIAGDELASDDPAASIATGFLVAGPDMIDINLATERRHNILNEMTSTVGAAFLGVSLRCAQCHHHKADPISIQDFYRLRAFFANAVVDPKKSKQLPRVVKESSPMPPPSHVMVRGDFHRPGEQIEPAFLRVLNRGPKKIPIPPGSATSSYRRTSLAQWIAAPDNPLALRVMANRLWQFHFGGRGIVSTPNDFGRKGAAPSHPELLDWLASGLPKGGWSLKEMHRLIVNSKTYRQTSKGTGDSWAEAIEVDPDNRLYSRFPRRRLSGEEIRDAMLAASGNLNRKMGGPGIRPPLPREVTSTLLKKQWEVTKDTSEHTRRSVYLFVRRNLRYPMFDVFDRPDTNASCARRNVTTIAPQALTLLNSELSRDLSRSMAKSVPEGDAIRSAYLRIYGRPPTEIERTESAEFVNQQTTLVGSKSEALADLCLALFNSNEAVYVD